MFLLNNQPLSIDTPFTVNGIQYPANWLRLTSAEEKAAIGITEIPDPVREDDRFYWNGVKENPRPLETLKVQFTAQVKETANKMLVTTDWMIIRKAERNVAVPQNVAEYRQAIVDACTSNETAIQNASDVEALQSVINVLSWPTLEEV